MSITVDIPATMLNQEISVYSDGGTGWINYGDVIETIDTTGAPLVNGNDWYDFTANEWYEFTAQDWYTFVASGASQIAVSVSADLPSGTYKLGFDHFTDEVDRHLPYETSVTVTAAPSSATPAIIWYTALTDELIIEARPDSIGDTYKLYAAAWGADASTINYASPVATSAANPMTITGFRGTQTTGTRYFAVRTTTDGLEDSNTNAVAFTISNGDWINNFPVAPMRLRGEVLVDRVTLTWEYQPFYSAVPHGFHVYAGSPTISYSSPVATVDYDGEGVFSTVLPIVSSTQYGVRAFTALWEETNTQTVNLEPEV
jgi:hypothetical protein